MKRVDRVLMGILALAALAVTALAALAQETQKSVGLGLETEVVVPSVCMNAHGERFCMLVPMRLVSKIACNGPAAKQGIQVGDIIDGAMTTDVSAEEEQSAQNDDTVVIRIRITRLEGDTMMRHTFFVVPGEYDASPANMVCGDGVPS